jgi:hypothetical protein
MGEDESVVLKSRKQERVSMGRDSLRKLADSVIGNY